MQVSLNNQTQQKIREKEIIELVKYFLKIKKIKMQEVSIAFIGDQKMQLINKQYRGVDKPTDVLSFEGENNFLGEILIDILQVKRQEYYYSSIFDKELLFIILHGLLHLIGYNDEQKKDRQKMLDIGKNILDKFLAK